MDGLPDGASLGGYTDELDRQLTETGEELAKNPPPIPVWWEQPGRRKLVRYVNRGARKKQVQELREKGRKPGWNL